MKIGDEDYLTVKEVAEILGVSVPTVRVWTEKGLLKAKRHLVSRYRLYKESDVQALLKKIEKESL